MADVLSNLKAVEISYGTRVKVWNRYNGTIFCIGKK